MPIEPINSVLRRTISCAGLAVACGVSLRAQIPAWDSTRAPGKLIARATAGPDSMQTFAVYLPSGYSSDRRWPVLFVLDPRGRAIQALSLFAPAAESLGIVVLSSYNSLSDGPVEPNIGAMNAMLSAAQRALATDTNRLYIAGMSGTARLAWAFALEQPSHFAGVFSAAAGPILAATGSDELLRRPGFALAMTAGTNDFNWTEVHATARRLEEAHTAAHAEFFDGPHGWPPTALVARGLRWFELRGMAEGRWPMDTARFNRTLRDEAQRIDSLESSGHWSAAAEAAAELSIALGRAEQAKQFDRRARELAGRKAVIELRTRQHDLDERETRRATELAAMLANVRRAHESPDVDSLTRLAGIAELRRTAASGDSLERPWARRVLANEQVMFGFYEPRYYLEQHSPEKAIAMLRAGATITPWTAQQCAFVSQAAAMLPEAARTTAPRC